MEPTEYQAAEQTFVQDALSQLTRLCLYGSEAPHVFSRENTELAAFDELRVRRDEHSITFAVGVRERNGKQRSGTAQFVVDRPLTEWFTNPNAGAELVETFVVELNEDLTGFKPVNSLRWNARE